MTAWHRSKKHNYAQSGIFVFAIKWSLHEFSPASPLKFLKESLLKPFYKNVKMQVVYFCTSSVFNVISCQALLSTTLHRLVTTCFFSHSKIVTVKKYKASQACKHHSRKYCFPPWPPISTCSKVCVIFEATDWESYKVLNMGPDNTTSLPTSSSYSCQFLHISFTSTF